MLARQGSGTCRVCGWNPVEGASAPARYCDCCGIERGVQDRSSEQIKSWRNKWLTSGGRWRGAIDPATIPEVADSLDVTDAPPA